MKSLAALLTALALLVAGPALTACTSDTDTPAAERDGPGDGDPPRPGANPGCDPELDHAFASWADAGFSGTVAITEGGEPTCLAAYGLADRATDTPNAVDTVFAIGSVTKAVTAATILRLVDDGLLTLDDRAGDLVPGLAGPAAGVTVEQLLRHTSGLTGSHGGDAEPLDRDAAVAAIGRLEQAVPAGREFLYSNSGYTLLALIVEQLSGATYRDFTMTEILPLPDDGRPAGGFWNGEPAAPGPRAVGYLDSSDATGETGDFAGPHWGVDGNGGVAMTTADLAAWTHALFTGEIVSPESTEVLATPGLDQGDGTGETAGWVSYDAALFGEPFLAAAGGGGDVGHNVVVVWLPESERVVTMASNTPDVLAEELLQAVGPALVAADPLPTPEGQVSGVDADEVADIVGRYGLDSGGSFDVTARDDRLAIAAAGADAVAALFPLSDGFTDADARTHEDLVQALLAGETQEGREEVEALESDIGPIDDVRLMGTIVDDGELRTHVEVGSGDGRSTVWYALDHEGGIAAVEITDEPPTLLLAAAESGGFRPDDPTGRGPDVTVTFDPQADGMTVDGPDGTTTATRPGP